MKLVTLAAVVLVLALPVTGAEKKDDKVADCLKRLKDKDASVRLAAVADMVELQDEKITSQLVKLIRDKDSDIRQMAVEGLRSRTSDAAKKKAAQVLAARLGALSKKSGHAEEFEGVIAALGDLARPESIDALIDIDTNEDAATAKARLMAVANCPDKKAVDELIKFLSKGRNRGRSGQRGLALQALRHATGVRLGNDADKWRAWWKDNRDKFDLKQVVAEREAAKREAEEKAEKKREREEKRRENREKKKDRGKKKPPEREGPPD
jgi:HEAT repeat protein